MLNIKIVNKEFKDIKSLEKLNDEAFPTNERMQISEMLQLIEQGKLEVSAVYDDEKFIGFYAMVVYHTVSYIFFLAIDSKERSKGYGSKTLELMKKQYQDYQIVLDMEAVIQTASNYKQRKARKEFYVRNGFFETGFYLDFNGMEMEVLCNEHKLNDATFSSLLENLKIRKIPFRLYKPN